jgi:hypothetical protein
MSLRKAQKYHETFRKSNEIETLVDSVSMDLSTHFHRHWPVRLSHLFAPLFAQIRPPHRRPFKLSVSIPHSMVPGCLPTRRNQIKY